MKRKKIILLTMVSMVILMALLLFLGLVIGGYKSAHAFNSLLAVINAPVGLVLDWMDLTWNPIATYTGFLVYWLVLGWACGWLIAEAVRRKQEKQPGKP